MKTTGHKVTIKRFRDEATQTIERMHETGEHTVLTAGGKPKAILVTPAEFKRLSDAKPRSSRISTMDLAWQEYLDGKASPANEVFDRIHARLLKMKAQKRRAS